MTTKTQLEAKIEEIIPVLILQSIANRKHRLTAIVIAI